MAKGTNDYRTKDRPSPGIRDPYRRLAAGILAQAAKEAKAGDIDAAQWLQTGQAEFFCEGVGLSFPHVKKWVENQNRPHPHIGV